MRKSCHLSRGRRTPLLRSHQGWILAIAGCVLATVAGAASPPQTAGATITRAARPQAEDWVLANQRLLAVLRPDSLALSVEDLATHETWSADPWENSAGRIHLRGKAGESATVSLSGAAEKKTDAMPPGAAGGQGLEISLARFRSGMGPVRSDRDPGEHLSLKLKISLAPDSPELTFRIGEMHNGSAYWKVEAIEWPMRMFPVRTVDDDGYIVFPQEQGVIDGNGSFCSTERVGRPGNVRPPRRS